MTGRDVHTRRLSSRAREDRLDYSTTQLHLNTSTPLHIYTSIRRPALEAPGSRTLSLPEFSVLMPRFQGIRSCIAICEQEITRAGKEGADAMMTFTDVDQRTFETYFLHSEHGILGSCKSFDYDTHTLRLLMIPSIEHASAGGRFAELVARWPPHHERQVLRAGVDAGFEIPRKVKSPDQSWYPVQQKSGPPSLVLECAKTETRHQLMMDVCFWLAQARQGDLQVEVVITIFIRPSRILIEKWKSDPRNGYRSAGEMTVTSDPTPTMESLQVTGALFTITFEELTRQSKQTDVDCSDLTITAEKARSLALSVWNLNPSQSH
ncbi:hypothetical protein N7462_005227 [Penicillium macrosclerotiorum]|uniref:uncharacterized protein n=1 Tax=Penicillium macrosclerotiorum TaxID=303699 RepID=UPI0025475829|nr:uncharacterized protein N7462_005227 [Penicillium macrosclerotiorum]KAJ5690835.1 hypothetical protein N7462_005227 [Penicillium macrosclerotiorum]